MKSAPLLLLTLGGLGIGSLLLALLVGSSAAGAGTLLDWWSGTAGPEAIEVRLLAVKKGTKSVTIGHQIVSAGNSACIYAEGYTVLVWVNRDGQANLPPDYVSALFK